MAADLIADLGITDREAFDRYRAAVAETSSAVNIWRVVGHGKFSNARGRPGAWR